MKILSWNEEVIARNFIEVATWIAKNATCWRSKCGSIIVNNNEIIWTWFNSPANNLESQRRCHIEKQSYNKKVTDKTCCVHAEQRAIMDALTKNPTKLKGSRLYFARIDDDWILKFCWEPYCTICSKMSLDVGISEFVLYKKEWICVYETWEYNILSYKYSE